PAEPAPLSEVFAEGRARPVAFLLLAALTSTTGFAFVHLLFALFCGDHLGYDRAKMSFAFAFIGVVGVLVQGVLLRRLLKKPIEVPLAVTGALLLALSLWLLPRVPGTAGFLAVASLMALGNGLVVPVLS